MSHVILSDPYNLSSRFSTDDRLGYDFEIPEQEPEGGLYEVDELIEQGLAQLEEVVNQGKLGFYDIEQFLCRIPKRESDLIILYHRDKMKQEQIAKIFSITQAAVSYRLHRGIRRIQFLRTIPELDKDTFELELGSKFSTQDLEILWRMYETTCQSEIAKQMKLTQGRVRHRFFRALNRIRELISDEVREKDVFLQMECKKKGNGDGEPTYWTPEAIKIELDGVIKQSKYAKYWTVYFTISDKHFNILHEVSLPQFQDRGDAQILPID